MSRNLISHAISTAVVAFALVLGAARTARAHEGPGGNLGFGFGVGEENALTLEVAPTPPSGIEGALGISTFDDRAYAHLVFKHSLFYLAQGGTVVVPLYLGLGGFLRDIDGSANDMLELGARVPIGINLNFQSAPLQIFGEVALDLTLSQLDHERSDRTNIGAFAGARYWF